MVRTPVSSFLEFARTVRLEIDAALEASSQFDEDCPSQLQCAIRHSLLAPCKRLRPLLVLLSAEACGYDRGKAMPAACAVEMIHTYSLIHDDLPAMDDDDLRRGQPSCHAKYGEATAILAGDALIARAFELLATEIKPAETAVACCRELASAAGASALVGGQVDDLAGEFATGGIAELERIHRRKTGAMFRVAMRLGALTAQADSEQLIALDAYGRDLGLAFQIIDDLLDVEGDEAALGKRIGKDSNLGKMTFPGLMGIDASRLRAEQLIQSAIDVIQNLGEAAAPLEALARYVVERDR